MLLYFIDQLQWLVVAASTSSRTVRDSKDDTLLCTYFSRARKAAGSTSGSSISVEVVAIPPLNIASNTALPTARTNLARRTTEENGSVFISRLLKVNCRLHSPVRRYPLNPHPLAH